MSGLFRNERVSDCSYELVYAFVTVSCLIAFPFEVVGHVAVIDVSSDKCLIPIVKEVIFNTLTFEYSVYANAAAIAK